MTAVCRPQLLLSTCRLPRSGIKPTSLALVGGFLPTEPPGGPQRVPGGTPRTSTSPPGSWDEGTACAHGCQQGTRPSGTGGGSSRHRVCALGSRHGRGNLVWTVPALSLLPHTPHSTFAGFTGRSPWPCLAAPGSGWAGCLSPLPDQPAFGQSRRVSHSRHTTGKWLKAWRTCESLAIPQHLHV